MPIEVQIVPGATPLTEEQREDSQRLIDAHLANAAGGYTSEQLRAAFDLVKNAEHWKNPIDAVIPRDRMDVVGRAIPWFTGTGASFSDTMDPEQVRVVAPGYWAGPCS